MYQAVFPEFFRELNPQRRSILAFTRGVPVISWEKGFPAEVVYAILCQIIKQLHSGGAARDWFQAILSDNDSQPNRSK